MNAVTEEIRQNRIKAVEALRNADESKRLIGDALRLDADKNIVGMCACVVISQGLGLPVFQENYENREGYYDYASLERALGLESADSIWGLNDERAGGWDADYGDEGRPAAYTFAQIGDRKAKDWGLEK